MQFIFGRPDLTLDSVLLKQYAGHYDQGANVIYKNHAIYASFGGKEIKMNAATDRLFYIPGMNGESEFKRDEKGKVTGFQFDGADVHMFVRKID